jgi:ABC-type branched-subunit amino acid transport system ATPase component
MALLEIRGVSKSFRTLAALEGVDVDVQAGTFHGLIGPNGSGKSTLLKAIAGAHFADGGTIVFEGRDITRATPYERARLGLSLKFQITAVLPELSVYDNVLLATQSGEGLARLLLSSSRRALDGEVSALLERFRLIDRADDLAGELSHGQQQWLEIAMAMALRPKLLLLDEPTAGMSPEETQRMTRMLEALPRDVTLLIIEHDMDVVGSLADRVTVLHYGEVLTEGTFAQVKADPRVYEVYLGSA